MMDEAGKAFELARLLLPDFVTTTVVLAVVWFAYKGYVRVGDKFASALREERKAHERERAQWRQEDQKRSEAHDRAIERIVEQLGVRFDHLAESQREFAEAVTRLSARSPHS